MLDITNILENNKEWLFDGLGGTILVAILSCLGWIIRTVLHKFHRQNSTESKQIQINGDYSTNYQIGGNSIVNSYFGGKENGK